MNPLDVAIVSASFPPRVCGIGDYVAHFADALRSRGIRAEVFTGITESYAQAGIVNPVAPDWGLKGVVTLVRSLAVAKPAVVHLQWERSIYEQNSAIPLLLPILLWFYGLPLVTTFHSLDGPTGWGKLHRAALIPLLWGSRNVVVCSERQLRAVGRLPGLRARSVLIPIGNVIPVVSKRMTERTPGPLRLVYFGFVWRGRNIEVLLRALKAVLVIDPDASLDIVGGVKNEEYQSELARLSVELGVTQNVHFRGRVSADEISRFLSGADMVLLPFDSGVSMGRTTLMAALAHGAPVVTMGAADYLSALFEDRENMEIAAVGDDADFIARAVSLAHAADRRQRLSAGAARLSQLLSWDAIADSTLALATYRRAGIVAPDNLSVNSHE